MGYCRSEPPCTYHACTTGRNACHTTFLCTCPQSAPPQQPVRQSTRGLRLPCLHAPLPSACHPCHPRPHVMLHLALTRRCVLPCVDTRKQAIATKGLWYHGLSMPRPWRWMTSAMRMQRAGCAGLGATGGGECWQSVKRHYTFVGAGIAYGSKCACCLYPRCCPCGTLRIMETDPPVWPTVQGRSLVPQQPGAASSSSLLPLHATLPALQPVHSRCRKEGEV